MTVCAVIVTYADRFSLLQQVIEELRIQSVDKVLVVDNGSFIPSRRDLEALVTQAAGWIQLVTLPRNEGSAKGFNEGLRAAMLLDTEFIWLLDDDNLPGKGALQALKDFWHSLVSTGKDGQTLLSGWRSDRQGFYSGLAERDPNYMLLPKNNFMGFHFSKLFEKVRQRFSARTAPVSPGSFNPMKISAAAYGGLFLPVATLRRMQLPDPEYVLYMDDFAFTYAFTRAGGRIWLVPQSQVHDLEQSYYLPPRKSILYHSAIDAKNESVVYYSFRNNVFFTGKYLIDNRMVYAFNRLAFFFVLSVIALLRGKNDRLATLRLARRHGESGRLGYNSNFPL